MTEYFINPKSLVSYKEIMQILRLDRKTIIKLSKENRFPKPVTIIGKESPYCKKLWVYQDIMNFIDNARAGIDATYKEPPPMADRHLRPA